MIRRSATVLTLCCRPAYLRTSLWSAETLPVACQAVFSSPLQLLLSSVQPFTTKSACSVSTTQSSRELDLNYRSPTETIWPASPRQQKVASRVTRALELTLSQSSFLETLVKEYGVCIEEVRMSPDMLTAYVLWSAHPDCEGEAQYELQSRLPKIRASVGKALKARHVPKLEFRRNQLSEAQAAVDRVLNRLKEDDT